MLLEGFGCSCGVPQGNAVLLKQFLDESASRREADREITHWVFRTLKICSCCITGLMWSASDSTRHKVTQIDDKIMFMYIRSQNNTVSNKEWTLWHLQLSFNASTSNLIFLCTITSFHQISSLIIIPSSIYNHFLQLWYFPLNHHSCGFDNLIEYNCRTPVALRKVQRCEENILRKMLFRKKCKIFVFSLLRKARPSQDRIRIDLIHHHAQTRLRLKKRNITRDFFTFNEKAKKCIKSYLQSCFF